MNTEQKYLNYEEAAKYLNLTKNMLYRLVYEKSIPHIRISGKRVRFDRDDLKKWMDINKEGGMR